MSTTVTRTKVILPRRRPELLSRQRLLDQLYELLDFKLILVAAPAGYGKTSLLVDFAHQVDMPVCWFSLDPLDRDPYRFISHFIAAITEACPDFGKVSQAALNSVATDSFTPDTFIASLVNDIYDNIHEHFLFILDDFHLVNGSEPVVNFVNQFTHTAPDNCHLALSSRSLPTLPDMPILITRALVGGLSFEELAFSAQEIQALALNNYQVTLSDQIAEQLASETEGWITGLLLSAQSMWQNMAKPLQAARVSGIDIFDYLAQQVLDQQPTHIREFLLRSSLLEEFDDELCAQVFGQDQDWYTLIDTIRQNNLFVLPVGDQGHWVRYHHLFRDFLQARLEHTLPGEKTRILQRLAGVYAKRQEWEQAYQAYQRLEDNHSIAELIEEAGPHFLRSGRIATLMDWIEALPGDLLERKPGLVSLLGATEIMLDQVERGKSHLVQAAGVLQSQADTHRLALTLVRLATAYYFSGDFAQALATGRQALEICQQESGLDDLQAEALKVIGQDLVAIGRVEEAIDNLRHALERYQKLGYANNVAKTSLDLGLAFVSAGRYPQAHKAYQQALHLAETLGDIFEQATLLNNMAVLYHLTGDYTQAGSTFEEALQLTEKSGYARVRPYILAGIGDLYADLAAQEPAHSAYQKARQAAGMHQDRFLLTYLDVAQAAQERRSGRLARSKELLDTAEERVHASSSEYLRALWLQETGQTALAENQPERAVETFLESAQWFRKGGQKVEAARAFVQLAYAHYLQGHINASRQALQEAFQLCSGLESRHILVVSSQTTQEMLADFREDPDLGGEAALLLNQIELFQSRIPILRREIRPFTSAVPFSPPQLTIKALGRMEVRLDGREVSVPEWQNQRRVRELFFYILAHPEGASKETLGTVFWPDSSPSKLRLQFKNTVYRMRYALGQEVINFENNRYTFNHSLDYDYDVESFQCLLEKAWQSQAEQLQAYRSALAIYQNPYLPEVDGVWVLPIREQLWRQYAQAARSLARHHLEAGKYDQSLDISNQILEKDACNEEAHRLAMRAYAAKGDQAGLQRQYQRCQEALARELQARPSPQTEALYQTLLR
ncbi:MAG: tetratricopeptide repeat protein [Anaerolineales bacterium]